MAHADGRTPILYLAPWIDYGGTDKGTIDWFRWIDQERFRPSLITTQPSPNRRLSEVEPYAEEVWALPALLPGSEFPRVIFDFIHSRGVEIVHVMNSRLGFDLLPDMLALPRPPSVVVQLHVEEDDRSGYVRYVSTRYASLVDAFSITSAQLLEAVAGYGVPRRKLRLIRTGVDAEGEFCPDRVEPVTGLERDRFHVLFAGRLVAQKDPRLMLDVVSALLETEDAHLHVVGEGELESVLHEQVRARGLGSHVTFHGPTNRMASWYRACDALLMTSRFEGIPFVALEAMAMGLPVVAPSLPGNREILDSSCGALIAPREDARAYAAALAELMRDPPQRLAVGERARARARERSSVADMASEHARLFDELLALRRGRVNAGRPVAGERSLGPVEPIRLRDRPARGTPLVSIIVPCFDHGRFLPDCLDSIRAQTYPALETIVVDDGSTDPDTVKLLGQLQRDRSLTVIRLPDNRGPSAARNAGIDRARGRYLLPLDADNLLVEDAVERLVAQLQGSGEGIGFIYPTLHFFGQRHEVLPAPAYNLHALMQQNFCDSGSLFDRQVFDHGVRFSEEMVLGHEDWDLALELAEREVHGAPSRTTTMLSRKEGFTRVDMVEHAPEPFLETVQKRHPLLYDSHPRARIKSRWAPALSVIALDPIEPRTASGRCLVERLEQQGCVDLELIVISVAEWSPPAWGPTLRRIPAGLAGLPGGALEAGLQIARGGVVLVTTGDASHLLADRAFTEKLLRIFASQPKLDAVALADTGAPSRCEMPPIHEHPPDLAPHAIAWRIGAARRAFPDPLRVTVGAEAASIARVLTARNCSVGWRHSPAPASPRQSPTAATGELRPPASWRSREHAEPEGQESGAAEWGSLPKGAMRRWEGPPTWMPPLGEILCRHRERGSERRLADNRHQAPPGWEREHELGVTRRFSPPGTAPLCRTAGPRYRLGPPGEDGDQRPWDSGVTRAGPEKVLGHVELAPLPLLEPLILARHPQTGEEVLIGGAEDPLAGLVEPLALLGHIEAFPLFPHDPPSAPTPGYGLLGLVRGIDAAAARHRYGIGAVPPAEHVGELGALHQEAQHDSRPVWLSADGMLVTEHYHPARSSARIASAARWTLAPAAWRDAGSLGPRARAVGHRAVASLRRTSLAPRVAPASADSPIGHLFREPADRRIELFAAIHPVIDDQLLTPHPLEAADLGYIDVASLGYLAAAAPVTGVLGLEQVSPKWWTSRFGLRLRRA